MAVQGEGYLHLFSCFFFAFSREHFIRNTLYFNDCGARDIYVFEVFSCDQYARYFFPLILLSHRRGGRRTRCENYCAFKTIVVGENLRKFISVRYRYNI